MNGQSFDLEPLIRPLCPISSLTATLESALILVIEDDDDARALVVALLRAQSATVQTAESAAAAWPLLTGAVRPHAVICDIGLPGEDGCTLLTRLRQWEREHALAQLPALALTAHHATRDRLQALQAGFQRHVAKPVDPTELLLMLQSLLART